MGRQRPTPIVDNLTRGCIVQHASGAIGTVERVHALTANVRWASTGIVMSVRRLTLVRLPDDTPLPRLAGAFAEEES